MIFKKLVRFSKANYTLLLIIFSCLIVTSCSGNLIEPYGDDEMMDTLIGIINWIVRNIVWLIIGISLLSGITIIQQGNRGLVLRFGEHVASIKPGIHWFLPVVHDITRVDVRQISARFEEQITRTKDGVQVTIDVMANYIIEDPKKSYLETEDFRQSFAAAVKGSILDQVGQKTLNEVQSNGSKLITDIEEQINEEISEWGLKIKGVYLERLELSEGMEKAMAQAAEAEQRGQGSIAKAKAEQQAAKIRKETAAIYSDDPIIMQLRNIEMVEKVGGDVSNTLLLVPHNALGNNYNELAMAIATSKQINSPSSKKQEELESKTQEEEENKEE